MGDAPDMTGRFDGRLYHATTRKRADAMLGGLVEPHRSYWAVMAIAEYYMGTVEDDGEEPAMVSAPLDAFDVTLLEQDAPGFEEPITTVVDASEEDVHAAWARSDGSWRASLDLIGSVVYDGVVPPEALRRE